MSPDKNAIALEVVNLSKVFQRSRRHTLLQIFREGLGGKLITNPASEMGRLFWALRNVSFTIAHGQIVGIIGHNGAGKTTLLRLLAGLSHPTVGEIHTWGRVSAMLGLITTINPALSGRENILLNGVYYGQSRSEIQKRLPSIIEFADIGHFIDHPFRTYSSGMQARLSFSIVTGFGFYETLLVDEALGAGDARFGQKASARMRELITQGRTVVLVSHSMETIRDLCNRVIWLDHGEIHMDGEPVPIIEAYRKSVAQKREQYAQIQAVRLKSIHGTGHFEITSLELLDKEGLDRTVFQLFEFLRVRIHYHSRERQQGLRFEINLLRADGAHIVTTSSALQDLGWFDGLGELETSFEQILFAHGIYWVKVRVFSVEGDLLVEAQAPLQVEDPLFGLRGGIPVFFHPVRWQWDRHIVLQENQ